MSAQQQAAQAQAQLNMQARQQEQNMQMQRQSMMQQQQQQSINNSNNKGANPPASTAGSVQPASSPVQQPDPQPVQPATQPRLRQERNNIQKKYAADRLAYQRGVEEQDKQIKYNNEAANKVYEQEQSKISEAKKKAAFAQQNALAKAIGSKGAILSAGRTDSRLVC